MSLLARVPVWLWLVLLFAGIAGAHEYRLRAKVAALQEQVDDRAVQAIEDARALVKTDLDGLARATESAKAAAQEAGRRADMAATRKVALDATAATQEAAGAKLVATGTVDETVAAGLKVGLHPRVVPKP